MIICISFFPYDDTLSVRGTTIVNGKNRLQEFPLSLYQPDCILLCFLLREVKKKNLTDNEVTYYEIRSSVFIDIFRLINLVHILLNVSSKSLENANYTHEKFRRVCKRKAENQRYLQLMYYRSSIIVNQALNNLLCRKLYNNEIAQLMLGAFPNLPKLTNL